ncbi:hypothetical protein [Cerasicoccus fimbriatus]|uniref:hypothetical protein n=1 Tax=Cerasicoccus fimbriatus TaxID=3014554 RepID=UPI0022B4D024|nr:hypothetical protein [Cerasicoccus sp. TK19100]
MLLFSDTNPDPSMYFNTSQKRERGFALVIALMLMGFIFLLLLSVATVTQVEMSTIHSKDDSNEARQNALFGLMVALGEVQKHTGPDQRVTGQADLLFPNDDTSLSGEQVHDYWSAARNAHWTGVWRNANESEYDADDVVAYNAQPTHLAWLVSGYDQGLSLSPEDSITGLTPSTDSQATLVDANGVRHQLLVSPGAGADSTIRAVTAPLLPVSKDNIDVGNYAWWVGDEGVKARVDLVDEFENSAEAVDAIKRLTSAQRMGIEAMTANADLAPDDTGLQNFYEANHERFGTIAEAQDLALLNLDNAYIRALDNRLHDITAHSRGVLADVKHGGLKHDLSYILGQPDLESMRTALNHAYEDDVAIEVTSNRVLTEEASLYATVPSNISGSGHDFDDNPGILAYTPTWEQLWSFHNMGNQQTDTPAGVYDDLGRAIPQRTTPTQHGLHPIQMQAKLFYNLDVDSSGKIYVETKPLIVLANPYAVDLGPAEYTLNFVRPSLQVRLGGDNTNPDDPVDPYDPKVINKDNDSGVKSSFTKDDSVYSVTQAGAGEIELVVVSDGLAAGEAQIFTLDGNYNIPTNSNAQKGIRAEMVNDYDPLAALRLDTGKTISGRYEYAALYCTSTKIVSRLYLDYDPASHSSDGDRKLIQYLTAKPNTSDQHEVFFVYPVSSGLQVGGGIGFTIFDVTDSLQQSMFYQLNYRSSVVYFHGYTAKSHPLEWAKTLTKKGEAGNDQYFGANLLRDSSSLTKVRWGPLHTGTANYQSVTPSEISGTEVGFENLLYDIPRPDVPLSSLGQLQHFNTTPIIDRTSWSSSSNGGSAARATTVQAWQMNYPIGNSYAHPRIDRDRLFDSRPFSGYHYDGSYLWNDVLWDRFYFSTYPTQGEFDFGASGDTLVNERYRPFRAPNEVPWNEESHFRGDGNPASSNNGRMAATNLMADGAFNINSTSKEAWKALFSSLRGVDLGSETDADNLTAPFSRTFQPSGGAEGAKTGIHANAWRGFRNLSEDEVDALAEEMVRQVRLRGPFTSMADFVNRRLINKDDDPNDLGVSGALQSALDAVVNQEGDVLSPFDVESSTNSSLLVDPDFQMPTAISGFPGYLLQGDVLSSLGAHLTARSDTFRIRAYGNVVNPLTDQVESEAWCEAIVQRMPDYVIPREGGIGNAPYESPTDATNQRFGRKYEIISFRWLTPDEI